MCLLHRRLRVSHQKHVSSLELLQVVLSQGDPCGHKVKDDVSSAHGWHSFQRAVSTEQHNVLKTLLTEKPAQQALPVSDFDSKIELNIIWETLIH